MRVTGLHVLAEIHDCDKELIQDPNRLESLVRQAAGENGFVVEEVFFHQFNQEGISGTLIVTQANISIHTWPESRRVTVDVVTCREDMDPLALCESLVDQFKASHMTAKHNKREFDDGSTAIAV